MRKIYIFTLLTLFVSNIFGQPPTNGLVAYYPFNGNAQDASGNGNNGTQQGGVDFTTATDRFGVVGKCVGFDGVNDYIQATSSQTLTTTTTSFWFKPSNLNIQTPICLGVDDGGGGSPSLNGISLFVPSNIVKIFSSDRQQIPTGYSFPSANQWYFVSVQQNVGLYKLFVNSALVFTGNGAIPRPSTQIRIGSATNIRFYNGLMDDLRIYNRALSDTEVQQLYQAEAPPVDITTGLVAHYKMDGNAQDASGIDVKTGKTHSLIKSTSANVPEVIVDGDGWIKKSVYKIEMQNSRTNLFDEIMMLNPLKYIEVKNMNSVRIFDLDIFSLVAGQEYVGVYNQAVFVDGVQKSVQTPQTNLFLGKLELRDKNGFSGRSGDAGLFFFYKNGVAGAIEIKNKICMCACRIYFTDYHAGMKMLTD